MVQCELLENLKEGIHIWDVLHFCPSILDPQQQWAPTPYPCSNKHFSQILSEHFAVEHHGWYKAQGM